MSLTRLPDKYSNRLCILLLVCAAMGVTLWHLRTPISSTQDDGYYYFQIARNLAQGAGSTFDGVNPTNGYQPLWLFLLVPLFWVTRSNLDALSLGIALQGIAFAGMLLSLFFTARLRYGHVASLFGALLWLLWMAQESFKGMEFSIHALGIGILGLMYLAWFADALPNRPEPFLLLGLACGLVFLVRLDTLALALILGSAIGARGLRAQSFRWHHWLLFALPVCLTVSAYGLINLILFGHVVPVSSMVKATWADTLLSADPLFQTHGWLGAKLDNLLWSLKELPGAFPFYVAFGSFGMASLWVAQVFPGVPLSWRGALTRVLGPLAPFVAYSIANYIGFALVLHLNLSWSPWYYVVQPWLTVLLATAAFDGLWRASSVRCAPASGVWQIALYGVLLLPFLILARQELALVRDRASITGIEPLHDAADWARQHVPPDGAIGSWNAGAISYLSERRTVNLDGLVNSYPFFEQDRFDLCKYWQAQGVTYVIDVFQGNRAMSVVPTYSAYTACASSLEQVWSEGGNNASWRVVAYRLHFP